MTVLEATVEVVKSALQSSPGGHSTVSSNLHIFGKGYRDEFITTVEMIYKKFYELECHEEWKK